LLVDLMVDGREALVVGGGREPEFKALKLLDSGARVTVLAESFTPGLRRLRKKVRLVKAPLDKASVRRAVEEREPRVVFVSTGDSDLDQELSRTVRASGRRNAIVCVVDDPRLNDFNMPAIAKLGDIRVGISTGGLSPAMASVIRQRIEDVITPEDIAQVRLQGHLRSIARGTLKDAGSRKELAYRVIKDRKIGALLREGRYREAEERADRMLASAARTSKHEGRTAKG